MVVARSHLHPVDANAGYVDRTAAKDFVADAKLAVAVGARVEQAVCAAKESVFTYGVCAKIGVAVVAMLESSKIVCSVNYRPGRNSSRSLPGWRTTSCGSQNLAGRTVCS